MNRPQLISALVLIVVIAGLAAGRLAGSNSGADSGADSGLGSEVVAADSPTPAPAPAPASIPEPEHLGQAQQFSDLDGWLQTEATNLDDFDGQVRIVQFWTFACSNCKATLPHLRAIYDRWQPEGLEILAVHAPEFDFEKDPDAIAAAAVENGITWPIALDTNKTNFRAWQPGRRFWPRTFVVDQSGEIRFDHIGEGSYDELEATVAYLVTNGA